MFTVLTREYASDVVSEQVEDYNDIVKRLLNPSLADIVVINDGGEVCLAVHDPMVTAIRILFDGASLTDDKKETVAYELREILSDIRAIERHRIHLLRALDMPVTGEVAR